KLYLNFDKELQDTNRLYYRFDNMPLKTEVYSGDTIKYKLSYVVGHDKLFPIHVETGKKVTKARKYNKRKKYIFFGSHYYVKRPYRISSTRFRRSAQCSCDNNFITCYFQLRFCNNLDGSSSFKMD